MAKQDVLDAINSTIVQNDIKAITANALNNVLTMMVENAGEGGSGDGAVRIMVPDMITGLQEEFIAAGEFSPSVWEQMKIEVTESGIDVSLYDDVFNTCFAHNAEVYQTLLGKLESHEGTYVILDQSLSGSVGYKILLESVINSLGMGSIESSNMSMGQLAMCGVIDIKTSDLDDSIKEMLGLPEGVQIMIAPIYNEYMGGYSDTLMMSLLPDGSITFMIYDETQSSGNGDGVLRVWVQELAGEENTSEQISENLNTFNVIYGSEKPQLVMVCASAMLGGFPIMLSKTIEAYRLIDEGERVITFGYQEIANGDNGIELIETSIYLHEDGTVTLDS